MQYKVEARASVEDSEVGRASVEAKVGELASPAVNLVTVPVIALRKLNFECRDLSRTPTLW